mmetsp:Transcript_27608/g.70050  ORF Transcript_27608/g.70050 Transcript_27608/m.70050 type:complete len:264 (+) Transcript_27608:278-1069(+)
MKRTCYAFHSICRLLWCFASSLACTGPRADSCSPSAAETMFPCSASPSLGLLPAHRVAISPLAWHFQAPSPSLPAPHRAPPRAPRRGGSRRSSTTMRKAKLQRSLHPPHCQSLTLHHLVPRGISCRPGCWAAFSCGRKSFPTSKLWTRESAFPAQKIHRRPLPTTTNQSRLQRLDGHSCRSIHCRWRASAMSSAESPRFWGWASPPSWDGKHASRILRARNLARRKYRGGEKRIATSEWWKEARQTGLRKVRIGSVGPPPSAK